MHGSVIRKVQIKTFGSTASIQHSNNYIHTNVLI